MKSILLCIGNYEDVAHQTIAESYINRIKKMANFEVVSMSLKKKSSVLQPKIRNKLEAELLLSKIKNEDYVVLLDDKGRSLTSKEFAEKLNQWNYAGHRRIVFIIGGAFGFGDKIYDRAQMKLSLSALTFNHQMARLVFLEQLYRGFGILNNLPYHND